jgi:hypothetical protein
MSGFYGMGSNGKSTDLVGKSPSYYDKLISYFGTPSTQSISLGVDSNGIETRREYFGDTPVLVMYGRRHTGKSTIGPILDEYFKQNYAYDENKTETIDYSDMPPLEYVGDELASNDTKKRTRPIDDDTDTSNKKFKHYQ